MLTSLCRTSNPPPSERGINGKIAAGGALPRIDAVPMQVTRGGAKP